MERGESTNQFSDVVLEGFVFRTKRASVRGTREGGRDLRHVREDAFDASENLLLRG